MDATEEAAMLFKMMDVDGSDSLDPLEFSSKLSDLGLADLDIQQLYADLEFILMGKANMGSDILQRVTNVQEYGGGRMYAEVYKWFIETSGLGLAEQTALLIDLKPAARGGRGGGYRAVGREMQQACQAWA